jgi:hypothetical protein
VCLLAPKLKHVYPRTTRFRNDGVERKSQSQGKKKADTCVPAGKPRTASGTSRA